MITPVLMAGGSGTRLWPLSRKSYPKQFVPLLGEITPFEATALRLAGEGFAPPLVLTNADFRFIVTEQLFKAGVEPGAIVIEPEGRNTAPAVLAAALWLAARDPEALLLLAPTDHVIAEAAAFRAAVAAGVPAAEEGRIVTFGISPDRAETGYGYLELAGPVAGPGPVALRRFVEKPDPARAAEMVASGRHLWNAGIFLARASTLLAAFRAHAPGLIGPVTAALAAARPDLGFLRLDPEAWAGAAEISLDYAVMEKCDALSVVPFAGGWSDLGDWGAVWRAGAADGTGVVTSGPATALDCRDTLLRSEDPGLEIVGLGLEGIIAVAMPDAVLVADAARAQEVKAAVTALKGRAAHQGEAFPRDHRPWGWFESLVRADGFQVKRILVKPGAALSLQSHVHRAEHWVVVAGRARVTIDGLVRDLEENQSAYIPQGAVHRLENPGHEPVTLIEVQTGSYIGEDDITRYEDDYARP